MSFSELKRVLVWQNESDQGKREAKRERWEREREMQKHQPKTDLENLSRLICRIFNGQLFQLSETGRFSREWINSCHEIVLEVFANELCLSHAVMFWAFITPGTDIAQFYAIKFSVKPQTPNTKGETIWKEWKSWEWTWVFLLCS